MRLNRFDGVYLSNPDDLAANRSGQISEAQRHQATRLNLGSGCVSVFVLALVGAGLGFPFIALAQEEKAWWALLIPAALVLVVGVPLAVVVLITIVRMILVRQDLAAGEVQQVDGTVAWRRSRYAAEFTGRPIWANNTVTSLAPGPYRFFYLPRSGYVLSAEPMPGMTTFAEGSALDQVLQKVIGFNAGDLEANRGGRLGGGQAARMVTAILGLGLVVLVVLIFGGFMAYGAMDGAGDAAALPLVFVGGFVVILALVVGWSAAKLALDLLNGSVAQVEGQVRRTYSSSGRSTSYYYQVEGQKFSVSQRAYQAMVSGQNMRVYYAPRSKRLVGLESIGG